MVCERVKVEEAAKLLGLSVQSVRLKMVNNRFNPPIGHVMKESGSLRTEYLIYRPMLERYMGKG